MCKWIYKLIKYVYVYGYIYGNASPQLSYVVASSQLSYVVLKEYINMIRSIA
jgi:hypothetical protein